MGRRQVDTDVVVVGGGPGGTSAAITCAERGLRVTLFERDRFAGERPGETLHPGVEPLLAQLGVGDRLREVVGSRHRGIWIQWGGAGRFEEFGHDQNGPWCGIQVRRKNFDSLLAARAQEVGVEMRQPDAVEQVLCDGGEVCGVVSGSARLSARMVIDATGASRWLERKLRLGHQPHSPKLLVRYGYAGGSCPARDEAPALVGDAAGWTWTARVWTDTYQWTRLCFDGREPSGGWIPEELRALRSCGRMRGADVTWRLTSRTAGRGWMLVGDAGAMLDPTSSHGVLKAIVSGVTAGHLAAAVLNGKAPAGAAANAYHHWFSQWFAHDAVQLARFYRKLGFAGFPADTDSYAALLPSD
jgi:flavin-dependent dehydrogenase